jgi:hypothetical protein
VQFWGIFPACEIFLGFSHFQVWNDIELSLRSVGVHRVLMGGGLNPRAE